MGEVMDSHELKNIVEATALDLDRGHSSCDINGETLDGSTGHDRQDMARLGRKQELGVCDSSIINHRRLTISRECSKQSPS